MSLQAIIAYLNKSKNREMDQQEMADLLKGNASTETALDYLEYIKEIESRICIQVHQLGFIKFILHSSNGKYSRKLRLHVWNKLNLLDDIHNHASNFTSMVLKGTIQNTIYKECDKGKEFRQREFICHDTGCTPSLNEGKAINLYKHSCEIVPQGGLYSLDAYSLHSFDLLSDIAITILIQDYPCNNSVSVFRSLDDKNNTYSSASIIDPTKHCNYIDKTIEILGKKYA